MRHEHLVVTVEADTKARIDDHLDGGESLEAWVADAIEQKLADEEDEADDAAARFGDAAASAEGESDADRGESDPLAFDRDEADSSDSGPADFVPRDDSGVDSDDCNGTPDDADDYGEGFEYVDDCSI